MGKLKDLWQELRFEQDASRISFLQSEINNLEEYCISHGYANITAVTRWDIKFVPKGYPEKSVILYAEDL